MRTLIFGGGLVGRSIAMALDHPFRIASVPWHNVQTAHLAIEGEISQFIASASSDEWAICWTAGTGVVGTEEPLLAQERGFLGTALRTIEMIPSSRIERGRLLLASSAGGIHGIGSTEIHTELSLPSPVSPYGTSKLLQELRTRDVAEGLGLRTLMARLSNVYGPLQSIAKPQGFISHLCRAMVSHRPFVLSVPPDTIRDFVYGHDVGKRLAYWLGRPIPNATQSPVTVKIVAAGRSTTLAQVIATAVTVARVPARVTVSPLAVLDQPRSTRFASVVLPELDHCSPTTSLEVGIMRTWQRTLETAGLSRPVRLRS